MPKTRCGSDEDPYRRRRRVVKGNCRRSRESRRSRRQIKDEMNRTPERGNTDRLMPKGETLNWVFNNTHL
ncbi:MAG: hypothetical protein WAK17_11220 [Candidatus Nitrosopolaris sp.]